MHSSLQVMTERQTLQRHLDEITYDLYVDCHCDRRETAFQSGLSASTVMARVRRHARRLSAADVADRNLQTEGGGDYSATARGL